MIEISTGQVKYRIKAAYPNLREKEKTVADYILENPEEIIHSTISQVADNIKVADATVFRFCKKIGFKGYQAMKIALASEHVTGMQNIHEMIQEDDDEKQISEKVFKSNIRTLEETLEVLNLDAIKEAIDLILKANKVEFYGNGGSGIIAADAHHKFMRIGIQSAAYSDSHLQLMSVSQLTENDVAVLISHTGANRDILDALEVAKENNVKTIGITSLAKSPLSQSVDIPLYTVSDETEYRSEALASRLAQLSIIDAIYVNVSIARKTEMTSALEKMRKAISTKRI
ncbi:MurR/RpiR family transcriptional regulator [Salipaludibacillus aurantiacus]|uniref:DNA-binding transcriptional regulator, MurR/RpiR family, contains HTH and SIS domains n=1 Tax=Salipaludibacillus aurantiacus TaxID=1601833 RepID=A0A1H9UB65_9BACI|nr:MurR/RpiR family transcriptional regulator [Salipaludibacillus aurantiacus]SES06582.1 DNA-binding transcriptional regulator, MurR/RpiR family, contains HTH and SIS domains [Salipaludibacillus aurantiacus]